MSKFNFEQEKAITSRGNVIVSAGAGSGKTTVLTERVKRNILGQDCEKVNLDELLILTFTNDAAQSMKNRIKEALEHSVSLAHLVPLVDSAHIETIDAYQKFIVSKFGQKFGYPKSINVLDEDILLVKAVEILQGIFDDLYEKENAIFKELVYDYCKKNDNNLFDFILSVYKKNLAVSAQKYEFLRKYKAEIATKTYFENLINNTDKQIIKDINLFFDVVNNLVSNKIKDYYRELSASLIGVNSLETLILNKDNFKVDEKKKTNGLLDEIKGEFLRKQEEESRDKAREIYERLRLLSCFDLETFKKIDIDKQVKYLTFIIDEILIPLVNRCEAFKMETGYFTFGDISNIATYILENSEEVRNELKNQYKLIMVDECQDNSLEQNKFIDLIANNNVFSVGDVKQSIYKFRKAAPEVFQEKYDAYKEGKNGQAIDMNTNYRSRQVIIDEINDMFIKLMTNDFGGANYKEDHIIKAGNKLYDEIPQNCLNHGVFSISNALNYCSEYPKRKYNKKDQYDGEATVVALDILSRLMNGYEVIDKDNEGKVISRGARYKDFAVLTYNSKAFKAYEETFACLGIPVKVIYTDSIKTDMTILVMANIFKLLYLLEIENPSKIEEAEIKHCLVAIIRSYVSQTNDEQIYNLFKNKNENYKNSLIYKKYAEFARLWKNLPLSEIYLKVLNTENFIDNVSYLKKAMVAIDKNNMLYEKTKIMDELGYSLKDLSEYFVRLDSYKIEVEQEVFSQSEDAVTLTTIHKSKGLEYSCVYLPSLFDFRTPKDKNNGDYYNLENKFFLPLFADPDKSANIIGYVLKDDEEFEEVYNEERLRLFYVALTRAKEDLVFVFSEEQAKSYEEVYEIYKEDVLKFIDDSKVKMSPEEIEKEIEKRIKRRESKLIGRDFIQFLDKSYSTFPVSPYLDKGFLNFDETFDKYVEENEIEIDVLEKGEIHYRFINEFLNLKLDTSSINMEEYIKNEIEKCKKDNLSKIIEPRTLYTGPYKYENKIITEIKVAPTEDGKNKVLQIYLNDEDSYLSKYLNEDTYAKYLKFIAYNRIDELIKSTGIFGDEEVDLSVFVDKEVTDFIRVVVKELNIERKVNQHSKKASKDIDDESDESALHFGTHLHALLEAIDFKNPDYSLISDNVSKVIKVVKILNEHFDLNNLEIFKEYQFEDLVHGTNGVIDLLMIDDNNAYIVDYKLKNIDDEKYNYQLKVYKDYIETAFNVKNIQTYLLSIINGEIEERKV